MKLVRTERSRGTSIGREARGEDGITGSFEQAYAGVLETAGADAAGRSMRRARGRTVAVACTPGRAEPTIRPHPPGTWAEEQPDEELPQALTKARPGA